MPHRAAALPRRVGEYSSSAKISFNQEQICLLEAFYPGNGAYNAQATIHIAGTLDLECLETAVSHVVERHEMLRTTIELAADGYKARVHPPFHVRIRCEDVSALPHEEQQRAFDLAFRHSLARRFSVDTLPLFEISALRFGPQAWRLIQVEHHAVHDGWSFGRLWGEIQTSYNAIFAGMKPALPEMPAQYQQFVQWQRERLSGEYGIAALDAWSKYLEGAAQGDLATAASQAGTSLEGNSFETEVSETQFELVELTARNLGVSAFVVMFSVFAMTLANRTGLYDITIGTAVSARTEPDLEPLIGMVVNTVPIRAHVSPGDSFEAVCRHVQKSLFRALRYPDVPLSLIVRRLGLMQMRGRNPVFQHCFSFHDSVVPKIDLTHGEGWIREEHNRSSKFDVNVVAIPPRKERATKGLRMFWQFSDGIFDNAACQGFTKEFGDRLALATCIE